MVKTKIDFEATGLADNDPLPSQFEGLDWSIKNELSHWRIDNDGRPFMGHNKSAGWAKGAAESLPDRNAPRGHTPKDFARIARINNDPDSANTTSFAFRSMWLGTLFTKDSSKDKNRDYVDDRWLATIDLRFTDRTGGQTILRGFDLTSARWNFVDALFVNKMGVVGKGFAGKADLRDLKAIKFFGDGYGTSSSKFGLDDLYVGINGPSVVPIPAALPLFLSGLGFLGFVGWRRRRA